MKSNKSPYIILGILILIFLYLRFYQIGNTFLYGWDQARDAQVTSSIIHGKLTLDGPRTGVGHFNLGPLWYYLLVPFFLMTKEDPIASQYLNILINLATFITIFLVTKKVFTLKAAFFVTLVYGLSSYLIIDNRVPWNVSLVPILSFLLFYSLYRLFYEIKYKWGFIVFSFIGLFFQAHFTVVIFPIAVLILWIWSPQKIKLLKICISSLPFCIIWFIPAIVSYYLAPQTDTNLLHNFMKYYFVGVHLKFILFRLPDVLIQYSTTLSFPLVFRFLLPLIVLGGIFFYPGEYKLQAKIVIAILLATLCIFGIYGGPISDYYFFPTLPAVFYTVVIIGNRITAVNAKIGYICIFLYFLFFCIINIKQDYSIMTGAVNGGLHMQERQVQTMIQEHQIIPYGDGSIFSYLYTISKK